MSQNDRTWDPLPREEVIKAVERDNPCRIPMVMARWWGEGLGEQYGDRLDEFNKYPEDTRMIWMDPLKVAEMGLSWQSEGGAALDVMCHDVVLTTCTSERTACSRRTHPTQQPGDAHCRNSWRCRLNRVSIINFLSLGGDNVMTFHT